MPDGLEAGRRADPDQRCAVTACEIMLFVRGKVEGLALLGPVGFASDVDADAALQDIAELFALMWVVWVSAAAGFQRDEDWLHHVFLRGGHKPGNARILARLNEIIVCAEYKAFIVVRREKIGQRASQRLKDILQRSNRGACQIVFKLRDIPLCQLAPIGQLLLRKLIFKP